jgi:hypothetical protein
VRISAAATWEVLAALTETAYCGHPLIPLAGCTPARLRLLASEQSFFPLKTAAGLAHGTTKLTKLRGKIVFEKDKHRLHPQVHALVTVAACIFSAIDCHAGGTGRPNSGDVISVESKQFPLKVYLPLYLVVEAAIKGREADEINIDILPNTPAAEGNATDGFKRVIGHAISPLFVTFFENHKSWLEGSRGADPYNWPDVLNFGRVVRNASSHGGKLNFTRTARPVTWHNLTYDPAKDQGRLIGADLPMADLLILMLEMSGELDQLGCPNLSA